MIKTTNRDPLHLSQKNELWALIELVGVFNREDGEELKRYAQEIYEQHKNDLAETLKSWRVIAAEVKRWNKQGIRSRDEMPKVETNNTGGYRCPEN